MRLTGNASRATQGALFAIIAACFLLPFASTSCADEDASAGVGLEGGEEDLTGIELVVGRDQRTAFAPAQDSPLAPDPRLEFRIPSEPFAVIALGAAVVGVGLALVGRARGRLIGASVAALVGLVSLLLLAISPTLSNLGLSSVRLRFGFWVTLGLFAGAGVLHAFQLRTVGDAAPSVVDGSAAFPHPPPPPVSPHSPASPDPPPAPGRGQPGG